MGVTGVLRVSPGTIRVVAFQVLLFGLLFLPDYSDFKMAFASKDTSMVLYTLGLFMNNPAFYILLIIVAMIFAFSFQLKVQDMVEQGESVTVGDMLIRVLARILILYVSLFFASWLFLVYKLMFMGNIYINPIIFRAL